MEADLRTTLQIDKVDQAEFELLLLMHFTGAESVSPTEVRYARPESAGPGLILRYSEGGQLASIDAGPALGRHEIAEIVAKVEEFLLADTGVQIGQVALFASLPTMGWFRYRDVFQLAPVPRDAPRAPYPGDQPLLLQFAAAKSRDAQISMLRREMTGRRIELLCVALTASINGGIGNLVRYHWSLVNVRDPANMRSEHTQEGYTWPGANGVAEGFLPVEGIDPIPRTPASQHYNRTGITAGQQLDLPDVLEPLLDNYFACSRDDQERFLRASYWFQFAWRVSNLSRSGAFTALVSAIEALVPDTKPDAHCDKCGRPLGVGPTRKFVRFVQEFAPGPGTTEAQRRELYGLRSALSHGGRLLHTDRSGWGGGMTATNLAEQEKQSAMWQTVRLVLVNWLLARTPAERAT